MTESARLFSRVGCPFPFGVGDMSAGVSLVTLAAPVAAVMMVPFEIYQEGQVIQIDRVGFSQRRRLMVAVKDDQDRIFYIERLDEKARKQIEALVKGN